MNEAVTVSIAPSAPLANGDVSASVVPSPPLVNEVAAASAMPATPFVEEETASISSLVDKSDVPTTEFAAKSNQPVYDPNQTDAPAGASFNDSAYTPRLIQDWWSETDPEEASIARDSDMAIAAPIVPTLALSKRSGELDRIATVGLGSRGPPPTLADSSSNCKLVTEHRSATGVVMYGHHARVETEIKPHPSADSPALGDGFKSAQDIRWSGHARRLHGQPLSNLQALSYGSIRFPGGSSPPAKWARLPVMPGNEFLHPRSPRRIGRSLSPEGREGVHDNLVRLRTRDGTAGGIEGAQYAGVVLQLLSETWALRPPAAIISVLGPWEGTIGEGESVLDQVPSIEPTLRGALRRSVKKCGAVRQAGFEPFLLWHCLLWHYMLWPSLRCDEQGPKPQVCTCERHTKIY